VIAAALTAGALAISASPQRLALAAGARAAVTILNAGQSPVVLDATAAGYALDLRGRPRIGPPPRAWFRVTPRLVRLAPGRSAAVQVTAAPAAGARAGDHAAVLLLASRFTGRGAVRLRIRVGVVVVVRVPGRIVRRVALGGLSVLRRGRARVLRLTVANPGDVDEWLSRSQLSIRLDRRGRTVAVLRGRSRRLLARSRGTFDFRWPRSKPGPLTVTATLAWLGATRVRTYRLRM
jgi:hypothetical protein